VKGKGKSRSDRTAAIYEQTKCLFIEFLGHRARLNIAAVTSKDIADFRDYRHSLGLAPATVNLDIQMLSAAFNAAWKQGHISVNPCAAIEPVKDKPQRKQVFIPEQVTALVKVAKGDWKGLILTGFYCGQRLNDCANIRWRDVDLVSEIKTIRFQTRKTGAEIVTVFIRRWKIILSLPARKAMRRSCSRHWRSAPSVRSRKNSASSWKRRTSSNTASASELNRAAA
jgi:Site-specific recombinase XerD